MFSVFIVFWMEAQIAFASAFGIFKALPIEKEEKND